MTQGPDALRLRWSFLTLCATLHAQTRAIDTDQSKLTVYVYKSGLFSAFADDHIIQAPIARGTLSADQPLAVDIVVHAADLKVVDPNLAPSKRSEVQTRMVGAEVLDGEVLRTSPSRRRWSSLREPIGGESRDA